MKLIPETIYRVANDDGTEVHPAIAQKVNEIVQLMKDAKVLGETSPVNNNVGMRIASAILSNYELRKKRPSKSQEETQTPDISDDGIRYKDSKCLNCGENVPVNEVVMYGQGGCTHLPMTEQELQELEAQGTAFPDIRVDIETLGKG